MEPQIRITWDRVKDASNRKKHRLGFNLAARVFLDPDRIEVLDDREEYGEDRLATIGLVEMVVLVVVYTVRHEDGDLIRLISARRANAQEQRQYGDPET